MDIFEGYPGLKGTVNEIRCMVYADEDGFIKWDSVHKTQTPSPSPAYRIAGITRNQAFYRLKETQYKAYVAPIINDTKGLMSSMSHMNPRSLRSHLGLLAEIGGRPRSSEGGMPRVLYDRPPLRKFIALVRHRICGWARSRGMQASFARYKSTPEISLVHFEHLALSSGKSTGNLVFRL